MKSKIKNKEKLFLCDKKKSDGNWIKETFSSDLTFFLCVIL